MTSNAFAVSSSSKPFKAGEVGAGGGAMLVSGRVAALEEEEEEEMKEEEEEEEEGMEEEEEEEEEKDGAEEGDGAWLDSCLLPSSFLFFFEGWSWTCDDTSSAAARFRLVEETRGGVEGKVFTLLEGADVPRVDVRRRVVMIIFIYRNLVTQKGVI